MGRRTKKRQQAAAAARDSSGLSSTLASLLIVLAMAGVLIARIRLLSVPLERDEGEYAYMGQLMLQGIAPYGVAANMKLPGTSAAYALLMAIFGQTNIGIHIGFLLVNAATVLMIYLIARRLFDRPAALAAAGAYAVLSAGWGLLGYWAHATHFVVLPATAGTLLMLRWSESRKAGSLLAGGLLYGVAFLMKQPGLLFSLFGVFLIVRSYRMRKEQGALLPLGRDLLLFALAAAAPLLITCLWLWRAGVFDQFWFWVVTYGRYYGTLFTVAEGVRTFSLIFPKIVGSAWAIWLLAVAGVVLLNREKRSLRSLLLTFLALSFAAVCPGLYFREHYFVLLLPAVALLAGSVVWRPEPPGILTRTTGLWLIAAALGIAVIGQSEVMFQATPEGVTNGAYRGNPFLEAVEVGSYLGEHTAPNSTIAVLGSEPEIYFYAHRHAATRYLYVYSMMEPQPLAARMQEEFIQQIERAAPQYIVMVNTPFSWLMRANSPQRVFQWWPQYGSRYYDQVGLADMLPGGTSYLWDAAAAHAAPKSRNFVSVFKRRDSAPTGSQQ